MEITKIDSLARYLDMVGCTDKASPETRMKFLEIAQAYNLNPFKREIHLVPYGDKYNIIVGYEAYIKRANSTGRNNGWKAWTEGDIKPVIKKVTRWKKDGTSYEKEITTWEGNLKAFCEINVKGWDKPFLWSIDFTEFNAENDQWAKSPKFMIKKVCIAQAFRLCFTEEMGGLPYIEEEQQVIDSNTIIIDPLQELKNNAYDLLSTSNLSEANKTYTNDKIRVSNESELNVIIQTLKDRQK